MDQPLAVMFTSFSNRSDKLFVYSNTIKNWATFLPYVQPVLFTTFSSGPVIDLARQNGWYVYPCPEVNAFNSPVMKSMYSKSIELFNASMYGYANGDILFDWGLNETLKIVSEHSGTFGQTLLFGLRYNYNLANEEDYASDPLWTQEKANMLANSNQTKLVRSHVGDAHDYFFVSKDFPFNRTLPLVVSREGFDTYLLSVSNQMLLTTVDGTHTLSAVHQTDKDGNMAHRAIKKRVDPRYNRYLIGKGFKYSFGTCYNALHKTERKGGKLFIKCNRARKYSTGPCKTEDDLY